MKPAILALAIGAGLLAVSLGGVALAVLGGSDAPAPAEPTEDHHEAGADLAEFVEGHAGDGHHNGQPGMERPTFPEAVGTTPTPETAGDLEEVSRLMIRADEEFSPATGVRSGTGTLADPYIIAGYYVTGDLYISDTDKCFIVKENFIGGQLTLNWNAQCVHVHHNYIDDLRVNENNRRTGYATGGLIELNTIEFIGQIRHYDGEFRNNVVGPRTSDSMWDEVMETTPLLAPDLLVANVDGFNQGVFHHNTFYGTVDLDLHGHHHGTGFFAPHSHYHGDNETKKMAHDHTDRWTSVAFTDNLIVDPDGYGLRYEDRNHAGDDRRANSESEETLQLSHKHHTMIVIARNTVEQGQIWVDVFNADDRNHEVRNPGWLYVVDNTVRFQPYESDFLGIFGTGPGFNARAAITVNTAKEVDATVTGNHAELLDPPARESTNPDLWMFDDYEEDQYIGIAFSGVKDSNLTVTDNTFDGFYYGVHARNLDDEVTWTVERNDYGAAQYPVYYDESVANEPRGD